MPASSLHSKLGPASEARKEKLAPVAFVSAGGALVIVVSAGTVSTVHVRVAGDASVLPAWSTPRTSNVYVPSARDE